MLSHTLTAEKNKHKTQNKVQLFFTVGTTLYGDNESKNDKQ